MFFRRSTFSAGPPQPSRAHPKPDGVYPFIEKSAPIGRVPAGSMLCFVLHRAVHSLVISNVYTRIIRHVKEELLIV